MAWSRLRGVGVDGQAGDASARGDDRQAGRAGERVAERWLRRRGYRVLARNLRLTPGEVDRVMLTPDGATVVVLEVKARRLDEAAWRAACSAGPGPAVGGAPDALAPELRVGAHKQRKLEQLAAALQRHPLGRGRPLRFDVAGVDLPPVRPMWRRALRPAVVRHYPSAFGSRR